MESSLLDWALQLLARFGYVGLFFLMFADTAMLLHFVPSLVIVGAAVVLLATTPASLAAVILVMTLASVAGSYALYAVFYWGGRGFMDRYGKWFGVNPQKIAKLERRFQRSSGEVLVLVLRIVPLFRVLVSIPAGLARMAWKRFLLYTFVGSLAFNAALAVAAYEARTPEGQETLQKARAELASRALDFTSYWAPRWWLGVALCLTFLAACAWMWWNRARLARDYDKLLPRAWERTALGAMAAGALMGTLVLVAPVSTFQAISWVAVDYSDAAASYGIGPTLSVLIIAIQLVAGGILAFLLRKPIRDAIRYAHGIHHRTRQG